MSVPTLPALDAVCGCGRRRSSHYADAGRLRGPDCPDFHTACDAACKHPVRSGLVTAPTSVQLAPRGPAPNSEDRLQPATVVPAHLREEPLPPAAAPAAVPVPPPAPSGPTLDLLDPACTRCPHRRGKHQRSGSATPCRRCACRDFTTEVPDEPAPPTGPAPAVAAAPAGPAARDEAGPVRSAARPVGRAGAGAGLIPPRRQDPRPAEDRALVTPAVVGEDDADGEVAAAGPVATVAAATDLTPAEAYAAREAQRTAELVAQVLGRALFAAARWYCPSCHDWPLDPGACLVCRAPLQPVYLATIPREVTP